VGDEGRLDLVHPVGEGEAEVGGDELLDVWAADISSLLNLDNAKDVDRPETGTMPCGHILVHGANSIRAGELTVFLVHVVRS